MYAEFSRLWRRSAVVPAGSVLAALLVMSACTPDQTALTGPSLSPPADVISDGANGGNPHFFFLNPMVPKPTTTGVFDGSLEAVVEICELDVVSVCGAPIAIFNTLTGPGSETVRVSTTDEQYIVNWHSGDYNLNVSKNYRISVKVGSQVLGFADVDAVTSGKELKNVATGDFIGLVNGRTLPIKFRIEEGALSSGDVVSTGYLHTCVVDANGAGHCAGYNYYGALGNGSVNQSWPNYGEPSPVAVAGGHTFQSISTGQVHTCGVTVSGDAYCWGYNYYGQLGNGSVNQSWPNYGSPSPVQVSGGHTWQSIAPGELTTCGLTTDGDVYCWGYGGYGGLGTGSTPYYVTTPQLVGGGYQSVRSLGNHTCAVTTGGEGRCWGLNYIGQVGNTTFDFVVASPATVAGGHAFAEIDAGYVHSCGTTTSGDALCWGYNYYGAVGDGSTSTTSWPYGVASPATVSGGHEFLSVRAGAYHSCGVTTAGTGLCWGYNYYGQIGNGTVNQSWPYGVSSPATVSGGHTFTNIDAGYHSCGTTTGGGVYCWGLNYYGSLGIGTVDQSWPNYGPSSPVLSLFNLNP